ncbi:Na(+)/H(+) antiporter subunit F1 [Schinkia azotoformans]|uniref:Na(+)/H(+) antiporter subunit F n=1 Tax=Schinkia azotoformans LMG 9581 TaxID=1131731 RepID=K6DIR5_SCHAZ|nr:Na(+)/H(+) antiporter subunit F1 [Schinkia azotoformans]EKN68214.1 Na(+)/H(+) antiporter subunit F [Schinkia azotoformans LMG 9581]MEC1639622.1 Na(+)/H(+) antiporter subunit F1 [Schinkia azotoformans]MEC1695607.1 Na(+)/H(+) antiporter subunit F1 [Schinkia azotoformans]MEC1714224.1 Na(+)/H(+) antiporter subunit F1 [Schinkia azotoformans]MEC1722427.1 Na(+)/H(+) antiporter subunit F1 [Schinkia azotoformans]
MIKGMLICSLFFLTFSIFAIIYRLVKGPSAPDRIQALDALGINIISGVAIFSVLLGNTGFFEFILLIGILSFIGTIAFARYIERGVVIERKHSE